MRDDDTPERKRMVGAARGHQLEARRHLGELAKQRATPAAAPLATVPESDRPSISEDIADEISKVTREAIEEGFARAKLPTIPDSDPPAGFSMRGPGGIHLSARGRVVWLVAILVFLVAVLVVVLTHR